MKIAVVAFVVALAGFLFWRKFISSDDRYGSIDRLRTAIDTSALPDRARSEMYELVGQRRLRPSQFLDTSA